MPPILEWSKMHPFTETGWDIDMFSQENKNSETDRDRYGEPWKGSMSGLSYCHKRVGQHKGMNIIPIIPQWQAPDRAWTVWTTLHFCSDLIVFVFLSALHWCFQSCFHPHSILAFVNKPSPVFSVSGVFNQLLLFGRMLFFVFAAKMLPQASVRCIVIA